MNGYQPPAGSSSIFTSYDSRINGLDPPGSSKVLSHSKALIERRKHVSRTSINTLTDVSRYHVEHLTTFVLDRKDGMITVDDGVRRLRLLDAKGKVWTQEMVLQVEEKSVSLIDLESKSELENFPVGTIQHCQAVMNICSFDSILALVCKEPGQNKPDLHLFQCDDIKANLICADIESAVTDAKGGKVKQRAEALKMILKSDRIIPPPPTAPAPEPPALSNQMEVKGRAAAWSAWTNEQQDYEKQRQLMEDDGGQIEMMAVQVDRDVQILNHILDDIEFFISKLQKVDEALSELAKRKKNRKGKKESPGEGVLTLRSRPPADEDFINCLQKFKHAFNQLGKLKDHIQNPSATELLHFLFAPLRMVIQASGGVGLARSVVVPLLTRHTIDFLHMSGTAEERHLWVTLGDGWTKCRLEWPQDHYFPPCVLRFRDGWEPPAFASTTASTELRRLTETLTEVQRRKELVARLQEPAAVQTFTPADRYIFATSSNNHMQISDQDVAVAAFKRAISRHVDRFAADGGQMKLFAKSKYDFEARNNTELSVFKDEVVEVLDDRKQWWKVCNGAGAAGYVPNNILAVIKAVDVTGAADPIYSHTIQLMMPKKEFELFKQLLGELNEKQATRIDSVPDTPVVMPVAPTSPPPDHAHTKLPSPPLPPPVADSTKPPDSRTVSRQNSSASGDDRVASREDCDQRAPTTNRRKSTMEEVQDELVQRLTLGRSTQKKFQVPTGSSSNFLSLSITYDSPPNDVRAWLEAKGFSRVTISSLGVLTGAQLFSLNKDELKTVCPDEGARVFSQVAVQKAALEMSLGSELQEVMRRRQQKLVASTSDSGVESLDECSTH